MINNTKDAYAEVYRIICLLDENFRNKVPKKLIQFFENKKSEKNTNIINPDVPLEQQNLLQETIDILAMLKLNYWCSDENEKQELLNLLNENERKYQSKLQEKYNPNNLFSKKTPLDMEEQKSKEQTILIKYKEQNFVITLLNKIKSLFIKK